MKIKLGVLFISALVLASGCARKCPPCPMSGSTGSYGTSTAYTAPAAYSAPAPMQSSTASYSAPADTSSQYSANSNARYVSK